MKPLKALIAPPAAALFGNGFSQIIRVETY
jgi:hypothetical protein